MKYDNRFKTNCLINHELHTSLTRNKRQKRQKRLSDLK